MSIDDIQGRRGQMRKESWEQAESIMTRAGLPFREKWELANQYWPDAPDYDDVRRPWWLFNTRHGLIRIGWRKRVIEIDWTSIGATERVTDDDVSKGDSYVHAWTVAKAVEYATRLRELLDAQKAGAA
jgi:hypothetical protein